MGGQCITFACSEISIQPIGINFISHANTTIYLSEALSQFGPI